MRMATGSAEKEIWKYIPGYPHCLISSLGRVKIEQRSIIDCNGVVRTYKGHIFKPVKKKTGYLEVSIPNGINKRAYLLIHRLVLSTFNPVEGMENLEVNHKDENKENNRLSNLEWMTSKENCNYGTRNKRTGMAKSIPVYCKELDRIFNSQLEAAEYIKVSPGTMHRYLEKELTPKNKYHWERIENDE